MTEGAQLRSRARALWGDAADLRADAARLEDLAGRVRPLLDGLAGGVAGPAWVGPARDRLLDDLERRRAEIRTAADDLAAAAATARQRAAALSANAEDLWRAAARADAAVSP